MAKNEGFVFFTSFFESINCLRSKKAQLLLFQTICKYALYGEEREQLPAEIQGRFVIMKPTIDSSLKRRKASVSNGSMGGAPIGNQNARKQPKNNLTTTTADTTTTAENETDTADTAHAHGRFSNVFLTDSELLELRREFPQWQKTIERLSEYIASTGKTYQNHYATLCKWAREDAEKAQKPLTVHGKQSKAEELNDFYNMAAEWAKGGQ